MAFHRPAGERTCGQTGKNSALGSLLSDRRGFGANRFAAGTGLRGFASDGFGSADRGLGSGGVEALGVGGRAVPSGSAGLDAVAVAVGGDGRDCTDPALSRFGPRRAADRADEPTGRTCMTASSASARRSGFDEVAALGRGRCASPRSWSPRRRG